MNVQFGKKGRLTLIALFAVIISGFMFYHNNAFADANEFYFFVNTGEPIEKLEITEETTVYIDGVLGSDDVTWIVGDTNIITATSSTGSSGKYSLNIKCKKPGTTKISGTIARTVINPVTGKTDIKYTSLTLTVTVKLKINNYTNTPNNLGKMYHLFDENEDDQGSLVLNEGEEFDLKLMVGEVKADDLSWYCDYDDNSTNKVAKVSDSGHVTALAPGIAKVSVNTYKVSSDNNQTVLQTDHIYVVVKPQFTDDLGNKLTSLHISDQETIYTNARVSKNLSWIIKDTKTDEVLVDTYAGIKSDRVSIATNSANGSAKIDCKAGYYTIEVFPIYLSDSTYDLRTAEKYPITELELTQNVKFNFANEIVFVGNQLDLYKNSNVYDLSKFTLIARSGCTIDAEKGIITFTEEGTAEIDIKANDNSLPILDANKLNGQGRWIPTFQVVSNSQAMNTVTLKPGETYLCAVQDLPFASSLSWVSDDPTIATITQSGTVRALKTGTTTVRGVETTKGGITKFHKWQIIVTPEVSVTLDKTSLNMVVGGAETITATYKPNNADYIKVKWVVSNTDKEIIEITSDPQTAGFVNIKALAAGDVTLILQDQNSYQLAYVNIKVKQPITEIKLDQTTVVKTLNKNTALNQFTLQPTFTPADPTETDLVWKSEDASIASVENGIVTYKKAGTTVISVSPKNSNLTATCKVTVYDMVKSFNLTKTSMTINVGDTANIGTSKISPALELISSKDQIFSWTSSNEDVAKVEQTDDLISEIKAVAPGTATIKVTSTSGVSQTCTVTVLQYPTGIKANVDKLSLDVGKSYTPEVTLSPKALTDKTLTWTSTDERYVTVDQDGKITAKAAGKQGESSAQVIVKTVNGHQATINVTVKQRVKTFKLNYSNKEVTKGKTFTLKAIITPSNVENQGVTWKSMDKKIATVTSKGVVKGVKGGSVLITGTSKDNGVTRYCLVVVKEKVTNISLNKSSYVLGKGKTYKLKATVKSNYSSNQKLKWTTSNKKVATVSSSGKVTGKGYGYATIRVQATDGSGASASCRVRVVRSVSSLSLNKRSANMIVGRTLKLKATVKPSNATIRSLTWTSSDSKVAYVDSTGKVTALNEGRVTITAKTKDNSGKKATCVIFISKETPATSVTIVNKDITLMKGESQTLHCVTNPGKTSDSIRWYSDDTQIVSVNSKTGKVKALRTGTATITVATSSGKTYSTKIKVVGLNRTTLDMEQYDTYQLQVINGRSVKWDIENTEIARISNNGKVSARSAGTTYATAIVNGRKIRCKITVRKIR